MNLKSVFGWENFLSFFEIWKLTAHFKEDFIGFGTSEYEFFFFIETVYLCWAQTPEIDQKPKSIFS